MVKATDWKAVRKRVWLTRRRLGRGRKEVRFHTATGIGPRLGLGGPGEMLLRVRPPLLRPSSSGCGRGYLNYWGDVPVSAVDAVYPLPLAAVGPSGLPPDCEAFYRGQVLKDRADALPTVPSVAEVERFLLRTLEDSRREAGLLPEDVAEVIADLCARLSYEHLSSGTEARVDAWRRSHPRWDWCEDFPGRPPISLDPAVLAWQGGTVRELARAIQNERAYERLPILADALEEAGCDDADLLGHCRRPGGHTTGCWAVALVLGKW
jgi:hypothetical protein